MIGTGGADQAVLGERPASRLHQLLQRRLVVLPGRADTPRLLDERRELACDERPRMLDPTIEINGRDERLVTVGEKRLLLAATGFFFAPAEEQVLAKAQTLGQPCEGRRGNQRGLDLRKRAPR